MFGSDYAGCPQADHLDFAMSLAVSDDIRSRLLYKENEAHKFMNIYSHIDIHTACVCSYPLWWQTNRAVESYTFSFSYAI